jgi:peroxiredoxin family protein
MDMGAHPRDEALEARVIGWSPEGFDASRGVELKWGGAPLLSGPMAGRVFFFLQHGTYEPAFQATSMGITAVAMGDEVYFVFAFDALRSLVRGNFGLPHTEKELSESARAEGLGVPTPAQMLLEARALGARLLACDTTVRICGYAPADLKGTLDEVMGLASLWRLTEGARTLAL